MVTGIKSRPVYSKLRIVEHAQRHLFALEGEGALALLELVAHGDPMLPLAEIRYVPGGDDGKGSTNALAALGPRQYWQAASVPGLIDELASLLSAATMGTRLYAAGTEPFLGAVIRVAADFGIKPTSIITEHRGSLKRRVQCVHCKGFTEDVTVSPVQCVHCGIHLLVRDHYSRRYHAYQGVSVDAEVPGTVPPAEERFA